MSEKPEEKTAEQPQRTSFVNPDDYAEKKERNPAITTIKIGDKEVPLLKPDVALTLIYGKLCDLLTEAKMLNATFSKAAGETKTFQSPVQSPATQPAPSMGPLQAQPKDAEQTPRVKEIIAALEPVKDLLKIDTEGSAMFVMVKPAQFLGPENFSKVAQIVRAIGGQYVSAGKNSHFEVSKAPLKK